MMLAPNDPNISVAQCARAKTVVSTILRGHAEWMESDNGD